MIKIIARILLTVAIIWTLAFIFKLSKSFALTNDQNDMYEGCVEDASHLEENRAQQYCRCITIMITNKYSTEELIKIAEKDLEHQLEKFQFATNYCNLNAKAQGD